MSGILVGNKSNRFPMAPNRILTFASQAQVFGRKILAILSGMLVPMEKSRQSRSIIAIGVKLMLRPLSHGSFEGSGSVIKKTKGSITTNGSSYIGKRHELGYMAL